MTPIFIHSRGERVRQACATNMAGAGMSLILYANDNDDTLPMARYDSGEKSLHSAFFRPTDVESGPPIWADLTRGYARGWEIFTCPSDPFDMPDPEAKQGYPLSFAMNKYFYVQPGVNRETISGGGLGEIANVARKILLAETAARSHRYLVLPDQSANPDGTDVWERHLGEANWLYGDGHIEHHSRSKTWTTTATAVWENPKAAGEQPFPQWIPWLKTSDQNW